MYVALFWCYTTSAPLGNPGASYMALFCIFAVMRMHGEQIVFAAKGLVRGCSCM